MIQLFFQQKMNLWEKSVRLSIVLLLEFQRIMMGFSHMHLVVQKLTLFILTNTVAIKINWKVNQCKFLSPATLYFPSQGILVH